MCKDIGKGKSQKSKFKSQKEAFTQGVPQLNQGSEAGTLFTFDF